MQVSFFHPWYEMMMHESNDDANSDQSRFISPSWYLRTLTATDAAAADAATDITQKKEEEVEEKEHYMDYYRRSPFPTVVITRRQSSKHSTLLEAEASHLLQSVGVTQLRQQMKRFLRFAIN